MKNTWTEIGTYFDYRVWARPEKNRQIYVVSTEQPQPTHGGYFVLATALKQKGLSAWDVNFPGGEPK